MELLVSLCAGVVFALGFRTPLVRWPVVFYALALVLDVVYVSGLLSWAGPELARALLPYLRRCIAPYGLLVVVMFVGVLPEGSRFRAYLRPVRGPLSVLAALLALCHVGSYVQVYLQVALEGFASASLSTALSLILSVLLVVMLAVLTITSFSLVRRRMRGATWVRVQRLAYPFFVLVNVHALLLLLPSCLAGGKSTLSVAGYAGVLLAYVALRGLRYASDKRSDQTALKRPTRSDGFSLSS